MIAVEGLQYSRYSEGFSFRIPHLSLPGTSSIALTGRSGCGKTTLLNLLAGILTPHSGSITVCETRLDLLSDADRRLFRLKNIGFVFQDFQLIDYLNVIENIQLPCRLNPALTLTSEIRTQADDLLKRTGLAHLKNRSVTQLSQGERQRIAVCRALLLNPRIVLADEPTGNLDPATSREIISMMKDHVAASGALLLMVTHDSTVLDLFDRRIEFQEFASTARAEFPASCLPAAIKQNADVLNESERPD
ncbi:MAG: ABC transporter ATP-binding protein [Planctomyces sp.]|jgi:putative ABC transport system ATP-binding protein